MSTVLVARAGGILGSLPFFRCVPVICALPLVMPTEPADAQPVVQGPIFSVSTVADRYVYNYMPSAAMAPDGSFAVAWEFDWRGHTWRPLARHYASDGSPSGDPFFVNTSERSREVQVDINGKGSFAVSWQWHQGSIPTYARRFARSGEPMDADEIQVTDTSGLYDSSVGIADDNSFAVIYRGGSGAVVQLFGSDGSRGEAVLIPGAHPRLGEGLRPFAVGPDGSFVVAYKKSLSHQPGPVYARYWRSNTGTLSEEITIAPDGAPIGAGMAADGSFTVVTFQRASAIEFTAARYDGAGSEVYNTTVYTPADEYLPRGWNVGASVARGGSFSIVWCTSKYQPPVEAHTYVMAFGSDGTPGTAELLVSDPQTADVSKYYPSVGTNGKKIVVVWEQKARWDDKILGRIVTLGPTSPTDLIEIVQQMLGDGLISNAGIANAIISSLENAQAMLDAGNVGAAVNKLRSLIRQIAAQAEEQIDLEAAATLIEHLGSLLDQLEEQ